MISLLHFDECNKGGGGHHRPSLTMTDIILFPKMSFTFWWRLEGSQHYESKVDLGASEDCWDVNYNKWISKAQS